MIPNVSVCDFLESTPRAALPQKITVKRTTASKYQFYLVARHYRQELEKSPVFLTYSRQDVSLHQALMEEVSLFFGQDLYVLEGYPKSFVEEVRPPKGVYCVAETEEGELECPAYSYRERRGILWVLNKQLGLRHSLRALLGLDWGVVRDYPEVEMWLRKAAAGGWTEAELGERLQRPETSNLLIALKKGDFKDLFYARSKYGDSWLVRYLGKTIVDAVVHRTMKVMGQTDAQIADALDSTPYKLRELEETNRTWTHQELLKLAKMLIEKDYQLQTRTKIALDLLLLANPLTLRRGSV